MIAKTILNIIINQPKKSWQIIRAVFKMLKNKFKKNT